MTLATRCPACGTVFRVVPDQLRVSQGWVRCGRCTEAFNATLAMVEAPPPPTATAVVHVAPAADSPQPDAAAATGLAGPAAVADVTADRAHDSAGETAARSVTDGEAPAMQLPASADNTGSPAWRPHQEATQRPAAVTEAPPLIELPPGVEVVASVGALAIDTFLSEPAAPSTRTTHTTHTTFRTEPAFGFDESAADPAEGKATGLTDKADAYPDAAEPASPRQADDQTPAAPVASAAAAAAAADPPAHTVASPAQAMAAETAPSFLLQADRAARWRRPGVRLALSLVGLVAAMGLAAQGVYAFRDRLAASTPAIRPALQHACAAVGCRVGEYRQIDALSVESSGLTRVEGAPVYRLSVTLRNRAALEVAAPALDLSLTDAQGRAIARRVLQMSDLNLPLRTLKAGTELPIQVPLNLGDRQVSGYTVEIFYP